MFTYTRELFHNHTIALIVNYITIGDILLPSGRTTYATVRREKTTRLTENRVLLLLFWFSINDFNVKDFLVLDNLF